MLNPITFEHLKRVHQFEYQQAEEEERRELRARRIKIANRLRQRKSNEIFVNVFIATFAASLFSCLVTGAV